MTTPGRPQSGPARTFFSPSDFLIIYPVSRYVNAPEERHAPRYGRCVIPSPVRQMSRTKPTPKRCDCSKESNMKRFLISLSAVGLGLAISVAQGGEHDRGHRTSSVP